MTPEFRLLDPDADRALVGDLLSRSADYVRLERGEAPDDAAVVEFFSSHLPGADLAAMRKLGLFVDGALLCIADMGFG